MARLTTQEREQLAALAEKAKAEEAEDQGYEIWVKNEKGHQVKMTGAKARKFMAQFGVDDDEDEPEDEGQGDEDDEPDDKPAGGGYFKTRGK